VSTLEARLDAALKAADKPMPFMKAVGGKRQLLPELRKHVPAKIKQYFEPFVGGGALFFDLAGRAIFQRAVLNDRNPDLIAAYLTVRDNVDRLVEVLKGYAVLYEQGGEDFYYKVRAGHHDPALHPARAAARFLFLNKTCFNGLYRVNKAGKFNVPHGKYASPGICNEDVLRAASSALQGVQITSSDFLDCSEGGSAGDFYYFDPPYIPASASADFTNYTCEGFDLLDQERLRDFALLLKGRGVSVLLSNSDTPLVRELYSSALGFGLRRVEARRNVNSDAKKRGAVGELLIW
jgi:DNA adenine methylase